jgi:chromodomain-containing protein
MPNSNFPTWNQMAEDHMEDVKRNQQIAISALNKTTGKVPAPSPYRVGDQVWLEATHLHLPYQSTKLAPKHHGPFSVIKVVSPVAFQLRIPVAWNIHNVFHASLLSLYCKSPEHGPNYSRPPPDLLEGEEEYEVECIINHRRSGRARALQYLIKWKGYPEADNTWEPTDQVHTSDLVKTYHQSNPLDGQHKRRGMQGKRAICPLTLAFQQCLTSPSAPLTTPWPPLGHHPSCHPRGLEGTTQQSRALAPLLLRRFSRGSRATLTLMQESSKTLSGESEATPHNTPSLPRSREGPCPQDPCKTSFGQMRISTQSSCVSSSTAWASPWKGEVISIICNISSSKNAERQWQQGHPQSRSTHSQPCQMGISRIGDKSESKSPVMTGIDAQPGGSNAWTKDGWPDTPRGTPLTTFRLLSTSMPQSTPGGLMRHPGDSQCGSSLHLWGPPPHSPHSVKDSMCFPRTTGDMWQKLIASVLLMSNAS